MRYQVEYLAVRIIALMVRALPLSTVRSLGEEGALESPPLWPVERSVEVTAVDTD
jgi:hypothetical protein